VQSAQPYEKAAALLCAVCDKVVDNPCLLRRSRHRTCNAVHNIVALADFEQFCNCAVVFYMYVVELGYALRGALGDFLGINMHV
jgi:hypothetical protein